MSRQGKKGVRTRGSDDQQDQDSTQSSWYSGWDENKQYDSKGYKDWKYTKSYDKSYDYDSKSYDKKSYDDSSHSGKPHGEKSYGNKDYYDRNKQWQQYEDKSNMKAAYPSSVPPPPPPPPPPPRGDQETTQSAAHAGTTSQPMKTSSRRRKDKQQSADKESRRGGSGGGEEEDWQAEEPDDEPSPDSQDPPPPQEFKVGDMNLVGAEVTDVLLSWVQTQNLDSWSVGGLCRNRSESLLFEEKEGKGVTTVVLALPSSCVGILPVAFGSRLFEEEVRDGSPGAVEAAKHRLAKAALDKLLAHGQLSSDLSPISKNPEIRPAKAPGAFQPLMGTGGVDQRASLRCPLEQWPDTVQLYAIENDDFKDWGLVTTSQANFSYQLKLAGAEVRLEARTTDWLSSYASVVAEFHKRIISGDPEEICEMAVVRVNGEKKIDIEIMKDSLAQDRPGPTWLPMLVQEMVRLSWWEVVRGWAPTEPSPSPMKLHTIFDEPVVCEEEVHATARKCLAKVGADALNLAFVVDSVSDGSQSAVDLTQAIKEDLDPAYLAHLIVQTGLPLMGTRQNVNQEEAAEMLLALVGTHKLESDMFSVVRLWQWLSKEKGVLARANGHTAGCPRYLGRTPSYMEFGEVDPPEEEKETGTQLLVRYEEYDDAYYRWNGSKAEEKRPEIRDCGWMRLVWDPLLGTFCSPSMLLPDGRHRPLPNKVCAWLRGRNIMKLVSIKHSMEATPAYSSLREEATMLNDDKEKTEELYVLYKNHGEVLYRRSPGGLGMEIDISSGEETVYKLSYSESKKTLLSQVVTGWALPRKVVTWLLEGRCLADLIPGRKKASSDVKTTAEGASWTSNESGTEVCYEVKVESLKGACSGVIYKGKVGHDGKWQALTYSEEKKEWLVIDQKDNQETPIEVVVPCEAISHVSSLANDSAKPSSQDSDVPRLNNPSSVRQLFPKLTGTELAEIEQQMDHRFKNPRLLAEALTHYSATRGTTPCYEKLAFVGDAAFRSFASDRICRSEVAFFTAATVVKEGMPSIKSFCAPAGWQAWSSTKQTEWPPKDSLRLVENHEAVQRRLRACCNHVSYANSCVRLGLHKAVNHSAGKDLEDVLKRFAAKVLKSGDFKWQSLFKSGAPKVLGDLFLACVGAIVMDSDHMEADNLLIKHYNECVGVSRSCASASLPEWLAEGRPQSLNEVDRYSFSKAASSSGKFTLASWVRDIENQTDEEGAKSDFRLALNCTDICLLEVEQHPCVGSSPRSVEMKHSLEQTLGSEGHSQSECSDPVGNASEEEDSPKKEQTAKSEPEHDGAIYCWHCEMWLNGPTQWADHEIGKKHRKAVRRAQVQKAEGGEAAAKEGKDTKSSAKKDHGDAPKKPPPPAKAPDDEANYDQAHAAQAEEDDASSIAGEAPSVRAPPPPPPYPEGGWPPASAEYRSQPDAAPPVGYQTVCGWYINQETGEWVQGTMLMPTSSANTQTSFNNNTSNWGYQGEFPNFEGIQ